ncbi:MAG: recombination protein RecR, partial [Clostridia bacterium]|nr:recombination protein RecR [Clostridia bacterium]
MKVFIEPIGKLINEFSKLPGVGAKTAQRYAYKVVNMSTEDAVNFANAILNVKENVRYCKICGNFSEGDICDICKLRSTETVCVVKEPKDVIAIEKLNEFNGVYHVLHGTISPLDVIGPNDINIKGLLERISKGNVKEVIMATNPDVEGEATAMYISTLIKPLGIKVTRLSH